MRVGVVQFLEVCFEHGCSGGVGKECEFVDVFLCLVFALLRSDEPDKDCVFVVYFGCFYCHGVMLVFNVQCSMFDGVVL